MTIPPPVYALLADGSTVQIRTAEPGDYEAVKAMHEAMSPDNIYLRFFSVSRVSAEPEAQRVCRAAEAGHAALLAVSSEEIVGCASYESPGDGTAAEVAFAVADRMHHQGIATLLLEHLVVRARHDGIPALVASTLAENTAMLRVFADAGLPVRRRLEDGVFEVTVPVPGQDPEGFLSAVERREGSADIASLRHVFAPASVVVIGASLRKGTAGRTILDNVHNDGFQGVLYAVNPHARYLGGVKCVPSVAELPETPELAVIAVPPPSVTQVAEACGARGVKALVVITSGLDTGACADLLAICRRHGMRLVGPDSFGAESVRMLDGQIPAYAHPEAAVAALARAAAYGAWRTAPRGEVAAFPDVMTSHARALVREFLCSEPGGGWLPPDTVAELLASYGLSPVPFTTVHSEDDAVTVADAAVGPVALKVRGPLHRTGAVRLDLRTPTDVRDAYRSLDGAAHNGIALQPMITGGTEVLVRVTDDHMFGPLIVFGLGGVATNVPAGHAARLAPLTTADADTLIRSVRAAPPLPGHRGAPSADLNALRDLLLRISRLAEDLPEITELDLNPVIARPDAAFIVDARTKVTPYELQDPFLRRLR
jgi:GNAT superfamily N-acetyltransferase/predicted CoA-binding protein